MNYYTFYKENKEFIDENLLPLLSHPQAANLVGWPGSVMYQKWAFFLAREMQENLVFPYFKRSPICWIEEHNEEEFWVHDWTRIKIAFMTFARLIQKFSNLQN